MCELLTEVLRRWVDPEFKDEEDMTIEVEAGTGTEEEVSVVEMEDTGGVGNHGAIREEVVVVNVQEKKRKKPKEKRSTRKKIIYDHAAPQVWKKR